MCTGAPPGRVAAPQHRAVPPAPLPCPMPSCLCHVHLDSSTARGWGVLPDSWGSARCQVGWRCVCLAETLPGLVPQKHGLLHVSGSAGGEDSRRALHASRGGCCFMCCPGAHRFVEAHPMRPLQGRFQIQQDRFAGNLSLCSQSKSSGRRQKQLSFRQTSAEAGDCPELPAVQQQLEAFWKRLFAMPLAMATAQ